MNNNEQEHPDIDIAYVNADEVQAWKRPIAFRYKGNNVNLNLHWDEQNGFSAKVNKFFEEWAADEKEKFLLWLQDQENLMLLDDLTTWHETNTSLDDEPENKYEIHKNKLWVAWDGSWGRSDILITDDEHWTTEQQIAFGKLSLSRDPEIEDVVEILTHTKEDNNE
jgi:hypothetical protein